MGVFDNKISLESEFDIKEASSRNYTNIRTIPVRSRKLYGLVGFHTPDLVVDSAMGVLL